MSNSYANLIVQGPAASAVTSHLRERGTVTYVTPGPGGCTVVFPADLSELEQIAASLSGALECPALLGMVFGGTVLLYQLFRNGERIDDYVSSPHDGLELDGPTPEGNAAVLCAAFGMEHRAASVERILRRPTRANTDFALAVNRHGELLRALKLPLLAAGASFASIEAGELPTAPGFEPGSIVRIG